MLDENRLTGKIKQVLDAESDANVKPNEARERTARGIAKAVIEEIKAANIMVNGVTTTGTAVAQAQTVPVKATVS